ncbi:MAG: hypothetical protein NMNS01_17440 [Nitrosomonas sp.]|nr:MAG: hypothetical protein NMNS01_17440 [Nitrosomonas sp.]
MKTRAQQYSQQVYQQIAELDFADKKQEKLYGSICHQFPIMVLRAGLAQSVAFLWIKAESGKPAYEKFMQHLSTITGFEGETREVFQQRIHRMPIDEYRRTTHIILNACIWYKRFAESLLNVQSGEGTDHD